MTKFAPEFRLIHIEIISRAVFDPTSLDPTIFIMLFYLECGFPLLDFKEIKRSNAQNLWVPNLCSQTVVINVSLGAFPMITFLKGFGNTEMGENMEEVIYPILLK